MLVVGGLTESRMFKKFISALKNDLKSFLGHSLSLELLSNHIA